MSDDLALLQMRFKRYLHYGSELPIYSPGDRFFHKSYTAAAVPSLVKLINEQEPEMIIETLHKVAKDGTSLWPDSVIFALAFCVCSHGPHENDLRELAYKILRDVCKTERDLILFIKFYKELRQANDAAKGGGWGFKRAIARWYLVWMPFDLADILLVQGSYHGFTHCDVLRLAHVKPQTLEQKVLLCYAARGLTETINRFGDESNEQVKELIDYIKSVESFKKLKSVEEVEKRLALELHCIERVPSDLLKHQGVWDQLIPNMDVRTLMKNFQSISKLGFLKGNNSTVMSIMDVLNNVKKAEEFDGHPIRVYIELHTYLKAATYCLDIARKLNHAISKITPARKPPKVNVVVKNALMNFYLQLHKYHKPTNLRYFVAVDVRPRMSKDRCHGCLYLSALEAATAMTLSLLKIEPEGNVTIGTFKKDKSIDIISTGTTSYTSDINTIETVFKERQDVLRTLNEVEPSELLETETLTENDTTSTTIITKTTKPSDVATASVASAIEWANSNKKEFDVFLILSNYSVFTKGTRNAIQKYRTAMKLPDTKVVTCSLSGKIRTHKDVEGHNMLCVIGFDEHVPRVIEAFAKGAF